MFGTSRFWKCDPLHNVAAIKQKVTEHTKRLTPRTSGEDTNKITSRMKQVSAGGKITGVSC